MNRIENYHGVPFTTVPSLAGEKGEAFELRWWGDSGCEYLLFLARESLEQHIDSVQGPVMEQNTEQRRSKNGTDQSGR